MSTVVQEKAEESPEEKERLKRIQEMPALSQCYNLLDFEAVARRVMKKTAWGYYSSAADDEIVRLTQLPSLCSRGIGFAVLSLSLSFFFFLFFFVNWLTKDV